MRISATLSGFALVALTATTAGPALAAPAPAAHVRGTVASANAGSLTVTTANGPVRLALTPKSGVVGVVPATLDAVKPGTFVGIANVPGGGPARALEVVVFPDAMRGTGEGDYPWDLSGGGHGSAMTNGTVSGGSMHGSSMTNGTVSGGGSMRGSSMTNATVKTVAGGAQRTISVAYKGGTKQIAIPANVPVVRVVPGSKSLLVPGAHVFAIATAARAAAFVVVGEHGAVPPM